MTILDLVHQPKSTLSACAIIATTSAMLGMTMAATAQEFPLEIENKFGTTVIETAPERVATVDYAGVDNVLALGFQPLTHRAWFGPNEDGIWTWAEELSTQSPEVLSGPLHFEQIAATDPDVILALRSGITPEEYDMLSAIAPVVAVPPGAGDYDLDWREQASLAGLALGKSAEAEAAIAAVEETVAAAAQANPDWEGKTFVTMTYWDGSVGLYSATDSSVAFLKGLGLVPHPKTVELSTPGEFYISISEELLPELDADVVIWYAEPGSADIDGLVARKSTRAFAEGREIFLGLNSEVNGALSYGSLLSLPSAIEGLKPMLDAALDGNPETEVSYQ